MREKKKKEGPRHTARLNDFTGKKRTRRVRWSLNKGKEKNGEPAIGEEGRREKRGTPQ